MQYTGHLGVEDEGEGRLEIGQTEEYNSTKLLVHLNATQDTYVKFGILSSHRGRKREPWLS